VTHPWRPDGSFLDKQKVSYSSAMRTRVSASDADSLRPAPHAMGHGAMQFLERAFFGRSTEFSIKGHLPSFSHQRTEDGEKTPADGNS
jgi:hypothetical protein